MKLLSAVTPSLIAVSGVLGAIHCSPDQGSDYYCWPGPPARTCAPFGQIAPGVGFLCDEWHTNQCCKPGGSGPQGLDCVNMTDP
ncbi:hypothetical protein AURDEDRAFT_166501 [Auricularia subglabra TFB-10046 SS5]|nr:hypothetical protein AURDEDRAFT_166501 [Auricularia subglabra TFB-10046 SS5]